MDVDLGAQGGLESTTTGDHHSCGEDSSSSSNDERMPRRRRSVGANHLADLARMTTMRNLTANISVRAHRRGQSSVNANERHEQPADAANSDKVEDFFRQVNKDARQLKRMSSDGFHGCGGLLLRAVTCCLRTVGLGNPGASVEKMAFNGQADNPSVQGAAVSGDIGMDDYLEEEDDGADALVLSVQKKKVDDLGELPALDWSHVSRNLLFCIVIVGALILTTLSGKLDSCIQMGNLCLRQWLNVIAVAVGAYFLIEFLAKVLASFLKWTRLLHANNKVWIFIKLHKNVSLLVWSVLLFGLWLWFATTDWVFDDGGVVTQLLGCFLVYAAVDFVSEVCKVEMAHRYMWRPYLERARESIWSQYVMFMMTDHAMGVPTKDAEGQALALGFVRAKNVGENVSLYTVGKAIGFVHANALRHPLGPGRPGTDNDGMINSKTGARLFAGLLFDALTLKVDTDTGRVSNAHQSGTGPGESTLPRPFAPKGNPIMSSMRKKLSFVKGSNEGCRQEEEGAEGATGWGEEDEGEDEKTTTTSADDPNRWSSLARAAAPASTEDLTRARTANPSHHPHQQEQQQQHQRGAADRDVTSVPPKRVSVAGGGGHRGITLRQLRQMTSKAIALQIMELFETPPDGVVSRKMFIDRMVDVFVQRRSLQLTLGDYEAILTKVGYLFNVVSAVIVFFVALRIFGYNIGSLVLTWLSLAVAFSFLFGSSASAFFESIIFIFVTKAYDVGDPVYFVDDTGNEDWYVVTRIDMLTTVFRRWDGQATLIRNNILAKKVIRNQWRSGPLLHHTTLSVSLDTPTKKLDLMKAGIASGMWRGRHHRRYGTGGLKPDTVDYSIKGLTDGNRLTVLVLCKQRDNGANMSRRFSNANLFLKLVARECKKNGISYTMPSQPVTLRGGGGGGGGGGGNGSNPVMHAREDFLGGEEGFVAGAR